MPEIPSFDRHATADEVYAALEEAGCAIIRELADPDTLARLNADFDPYVNRVKLGSTEFAGFKTRRVNNLIAKSAACGELAIHPLVLGLCERVLLPYCARYHLHVTSLIELQPGEKAQNLHRDGDIYPVRFPSIPMTLGTMWALGEFTAENGGTLVVPGSHRWAAERVARPEEVRSTVMPKGSVLLYTGNFMHAGGANRTNGLRRGMALHYGLGWLRQEENQYLSLPPEVARHLPVALQRLVGYDLGGPYLGFVEEGNPLALLRDDVARDMARTSAELEAARDRLRAAPLELRPASETRQAVPPSPWAAPR